MACYRTLDNVQWNWEIPKKEIEWENLEQNPGKNLIVISSFG